MNKWKNLATGDEVEMLEQFPRTCTHAIGTFHVVLKGIERFMRGSFEKLPHELPKKLQPETNRRD